MHRKYLIDELCTCLGASSYLEIGTAGFDTFAHIRVARKCGVDVQMPLPQPIPQLPLTIDSDAGRTQVTLFQKTSDEFFQTDAVQLAPFDVVFVDGMHLYEFVSRDIRNSLGLLAPKGIILLHDTCPRSFESQLRHRQSGGPWHGDVWKAVVEIYLYRPDVAIMTWIDGTFHGTGSDYPDHMTILHRNQTPRATTEIPYVARADIAQLSYDYYLQNRTVYLNVQTREKIISTHQVSSA